LAINLLEAIWSLLTKRKEGRDKAWKGAENRRHQIKLGRLGKPLFTESRERNLFKVMKENSSTKSKINKGKIK
jgi:hypothetical protein